MGCIDGVEIAVMRDFPVEVLPVEVTTCADDVCNSEQIARAMTSPDQVSFGIAGYVALDETNERDVAVTFEVRSTSTGEVLLQASGTGRLRRSQPNGSGCGPTCFGTLLTYSGAGDSLTE